MNEKLEILKRDYMEIAIPSELDFVVGEALQKMGISKMMRKNRFKKTKTATAAAVAALAILTAGVNASPVFAAALTKVPVIGSVVKVLTFREYAVNDGTFNSNIEIPAIQGLENKGLENSLNGKYFEEGKELYEQFNAEMEEMKANGGGHLGVDSGYEVKTDNENILSIGRYTVNTVGSSSTTMKYDTIDKKNGILITLPSLFKDDSYVDRISENIKTQMLEQNKADGDKIYWVAGIEEVSSMKLFDKIPKEQNFYINPEGKLVISFDKYEVAPGYMGVVEFVIPTEVLSDILVGGGYIK